MEKLERHVIVEDPTLAAGFTQIPNGVLRRPDLQPGAKLTYMVLLSYAWQKDHAYPGQDRLAADMGVSERSVITYLKQLQESGLITIQRRGLGKTNVYILHRISGSENIADQTRSEKSAPAEVKNQTPPEMQDLRGKNTQEKKTKRKRSVESSNGQTIDYDEDRLALLPFVEDFSREFGDEAPLPSSLSRMVNIYKRSQLDLDTFVDRLYTARALTKEHSGSITKAQENGGPWAKKNRFPYFIAIVEDLIEAS
jgi:DNA-binding PadR family transcriptional regulator